jgi:hypothetical protein
LHFFNIKDTEGTINRSTATKYLGNNNIQCKALPCTTSACNALLSHPQSQPAIEAHALHNNLQYKKMFHRATSICISKHSIVQL